MFQRAAKSLLDALGLEVIPRWRMKHHAQAAYLGRLLDHLDVDVVLDVGANEGQFRDFLRLQVGYAGRIISFEPIPECVAAMQRRAHGDSRWDIRSVALGSVAERRPFNVMESTVFSSMLPPAPDAPERFHQANRPHRQIEVEVQTLQSIIGSLRDSGSQSIYLKLDTQGFDAEVIRGAGCELQHVTALQIELSLTPLYEGAPPWHTVVPELVRLGFEVSGFFPNNPQHFPHCYEVDCHMIRSSADAGTLE